MGVGQNVAYLEGFIIIVIIINIVIINNHFYCAHYKKNARTLQMSAAAVYAIHGATKWVVCV